jgi:cell division protein FtsB
VALIALLVILHGQLWFGRGSVPNVSRLVRQLEEQQLSNASAARFNERLSAEISDLREGLEIVEERPVPNWAWSVSTKFYVQITR